MRVIMWPVVIAVRVDDDRQAAEQVFAAENRAGNHSVFRVPKSETVAEKIFALSSNFKANNHFPVSIPAEK